MESANESTGKLRVDIKCVVCGSDLYSTDHGNQEVTYHCSSTEARFWDYERGTYEQVVAKDHWDKSRQEIFLNQN
jgi:hypothetical protein